ncbi:uncharacterized protein B0I36DRAFT_368613 [Microdochium trichocladiopsis]|uniref:Uncharacterized protein n=1 Tax=Microdochium trichocladiopsis TaxID=1682393 RepID=A0A9P8XWI3_9PEZI|nr:uncharacterized protein B0I36DRAFT_368613 [Microdochium trichocladiopsis]KAH7018606.1 hypothetical protein B0I36DRAFT_368613 [Microdochium trichocladiopsis]
MVATKLALGAVMAALTTTGSAGSLKIKNHCSGTVNIVISHNGGCDYGQSKKCIRDGGKPYQIKSNGSTSFAWIGDGKGASLKISKSDPKKILQYEYALVKSGDYKGLYWDLSDLDGSGNGLVGTPFRGDNVHVKPSGNGAGKGTCVPIKCAANKVCLDSYQHPDDPNTKWCPVDTGDIWIALCQPNSQFNSRDLNDEDIEIVDTTPPQEGEAPVDDSAAPVMPKIVLDYFLHHTEEPSSPAAAKVSRAYYA